MFINTVEFRDWPECDPTHSQDQVAYLRPAIAEIREKLEELDPNVPASDETARDDLKNIKWFIQRVMKLFDDYPEYWSEEYLREVDEE
jgi:hypothetical protein